MKYIISKDAAKEIANITEIVSDQVSIESREGGWTITAADPAHVSMIRYTLEAKEFIEFDAKDKDIVFPLSVLKAVLSLADEKIEIEVTDQIIFSTGNITRKTALIDSSVSKPKFPSISLNTEVELEPASVLKAIRGTDFVDYITIEVGPSGTKVSAEGDTDSIDIVFEGQTSESQVKSNYPMDYLITALKSMPDKVCMRLETDYPMMIEAQGCGNIEYLLAPRIEQAE